MSLLGWLLLGLVSGYIGNKVVRDGGGGLLNDIIVGILGALLGGFLFNFFGERGITGLNPWSFMVAIIGAIVLLVMFNAIRGRSSRR